METKKISIIVPIYKVEQFINKCIDSIVNQSYNNLEIILIDDGSPDRCPEICDEWAKKDSRIKVIHKENGGAASARNAGLEIATGDYIGFVDSDDWIDKDMYEFLIKQLPEDADFIRCSLRKIGLNSVTEICNNGKIEILTSNEYLIKLFSNNILNSNCWCKLYKRSIIGNTKFPENNKIGEDHYFNYLITKKANKIVTVNTSKYNYVIRSNSITNEGELTSWLQNVKSHKIIFEKEKKNNIVAPYAAECYANWILDFIALCIKLNKRKSDEYYFIKELLNKSINDMFKSKLNKKLNIKLLLAKYFPFFYEFILKIYFLKNKNN